MEVFYERSKKYNCRVKGKPYFRTSVTLDGKCHQIYGDGEKDALRKKEKLIEQHKAGFNLEFKNEKIGDALEYWLYNVKRVNRKVKASSFSRYESIFRNHIKPYPIMDCKTVKFNSAILQAYITEMNERHGVTGATCESIIKVWRMFSGWAVEQGYLTKNPCNGLSIPGEHSNGKRTIETFSEDERNALVEYLNNHPYWYDTVVRLAFLTGMREGELLGLEWTDIQDDGIHVNQTTSMVTHVDNQGNRERKREVWDTKTKNSVRIIPISARTRQMLSEYKTQQLAYFISKGYGRPKYVFTTQMGKLVDPTSFIKSYKRLLKRAGIKYRKFHAVRHTFATEAIKKGVDVKQLSLILGHSDIKTTYIYVQVDEASKREAIEKIGAIV